jgi:hypothetical protein
MQITVLTRPVLHSWVIDEFFRLPSSASSQEAVTTLGGSDLYIDVEATAFVSG